jgi:hypothetical protein
MKPIPVQTTNFVTASDLFATKAMRKLWDDFTEGNPKVTWGDANRTMVVAAFIVNELEEGDVHPASIKALRRRIERLPEQYECYVDLEN